MRAAIIATLVLMNMASLAKAQIYQHVDEHGVTHFSDQPPASENFRVVEQADLDAITTTVPGTPLSDTELQRGAVARQRHRSAGSEARQRLQAAQDANTARCAAYQERLDTIQSRLRRGYGIEAGNRLRERRREIRGAMARDCR